MATARIPQPITDDPVKVDPQHYKVEFENERVRVLRIKYGAGEKSVMHSHPESIAVFLTDAHAKFTSSPTRTDGVKTSTRTPGRFSTWMPLPTCLKTPAKRHSRSSKSS